MRACRGEHALDSCPEAGWSEGSGCTVGGLSPEVPGVCECRLHACDTKDGTPGKPSQGLLPAQVPAGGNSDEIKSEVLESLQ